MIIKSITSCARCGNDHESLLFKEMKRPIPDGEDDVPWTHWALCPVSKDPILLCIMQDTVWHHEQ